ncbi:MAG: fibronectin type III domain-containing protein [Candidatus Methylomirabilia bacterium]
MRRLLLLALIGGLATSACGKKGPPVAPERRLPARVSALTATVQGEAVVLSWTNPASRADGTRLRDLTTLRVYRRHERRDGEPKPAMLARGKVIGFDQVATIRLATPVPAQVEGDRVRWTDPTPLTAGERYVYVVTALDSIGRSSPPSERAVAVFMAAPEPPGTLTAKPGDGEVRLQWAAPSSLIDGTPATGPLTYQVLRAASVEASLQAIIPRPIEATHFTDRGLENDQTYYYAVRAIRVEPQGEAGSELSSMVSATPVDLTPPSAPTDLVALPTEDAVRLLWNRSPEADLAGYLVYRAARPGGPYDRLTTEPIRTTLFTDRAVERGRTYGYVVTAVDQAARANESARSNEVTVTVP